MATVRENLIAARALIETPEKWIKGVASNNGCYCALGAIKQLTGVFYGPERDALVAALPTDFWPSIADYNDDPATTHADMMALFQRAIEAEE